MAKKMQHGGKREGSGRPAKPEGERAVVVAVSMTPSERDSLDTLKDTHGFSRSQMVAELIRRAAKRSKKG